MDRRTVLSGVMGALAVPTFAAAQTRQIVVLTGTVTNANFARVCGMIADATDSIIGLKLRFDLPFREPFEAEHGDGNSAWIFDGEHELNFAEGAAWSHGSIVFDAFYLVKYGSMNQGIMSFGATKVDEAMIRLNPAIQIVERGV
jgi:hypothetical protein